MGFSDARRGGRSATLVRHHLLLPDTATRRDIDDPATIDRVAATIGHDPRVLELLHALAQADGAATERLGVVAVEGAPRGRARRPGAGGAGRRSRRDDREPVLRPTEPQAAAADVPGRPARSRSASRTSPTGSRSRSARPTGPGCSAPRRGAGAQPVRRPRGEDVGRGRPATGVFAVRPRFGRAPVPEILADGVRAALEGTLPLADRLRQREADYRQNGARARRRASHGTTARSAATRPASSRSAPATAPGCSTG